MLHRLTNIEKKLNRILYFYCAIFAAVCMIFAFSGCSNMRSVKSKNYQGISKAEKSKKNYEKIDTVSGNISQFEEKILTNKALLNKANSNSDDFEDESISNSTQSAIDITAKRLPTLREQMNLLAQDQESIKTQVNTLQTDVNEIKNSIDDIKDAITILKFSPEKTPQKGIEPEDDYDYEPTDEQLQEEIIEEDYSVVQPDEKISKKNVSAKPIAKNNTKKITKPVTKKVKPTNNDLNHIQKSIDKKSEIKPNNTKKAEPNNFKAATKIETKPVQTNTNIPNDLNNSVKSALDYFAKKDYHKAINELNTIMTKSNDNQTLSNCNYWLGESYFRLTNYSEAIKFFYKTANDNGSPKNAEARIMIGESFIRMGKVDSAKDAFQSFLTNYPKSQYAPRAKKMLQQL